MESINYKNPIFVNYINVAHISRSQAKIILEAQNEFFKNYDNITIWHVAVSDQPSKIECIYDGTFKNDNVIKLISELTDRMEEFNNIDDLKLFIRSFRIDNIIK